jgi:hypothetical protein
MLTRLTDAQRWVILQTPRASDETVAQIVGANRSTVHHARWRMARNGWTCSVRYGVCRYCGQPAALKGASRMHAYHAACKPLAQKRLQERRDMRRPIEDQQLTRLQRWRDAMQARTRALARNTGQRWTAGEDALVLALTDRPIIESCVRLGRLFAAVSKRRSRIAVRYVS